MKSSLGTLLDSGESGLFLLEGDVDANVVRLQSLARGYDYIWLDANAVSDKSDFLQQAKTAFHLPDYFGENWDALTDCLMDLSWLPGPRWVVLVRGLERLFGLDPQSYQTIFEILDEARTFWEEQEQPFIVLLGEDCGPEAASLPPVAFT